MSQIIQKVKQGMSLALVAATLSVSVLAGAVAMAAPIHMEMVAMPHPDDEHQAWSQIEDSTGNYKVFIYFTRGEQTTYCATPSLQTNWNEISPSVLPNAITRAYLLR